MKKKAVMLLILSLLLLPTIGSAAVEDIATCLQKHKTCDYVGTINETPSFHLHLTSSNAGTSGLIYYDKNGIETAVKLDLSGIPTIAEMNEANRAIGFFKITGKTPAALLGTWTLPNGTNKKSLRLTLHSPYKTPALKQQYHATPPPMLQCRKWGWDSEVDGFEIETSESIRYQLCGTDICCRIVSENIIPMQGGKVSRVYRTMIYSDISQFSRNVIGSVWTLGFSNKKIVDKKNWVVGYPLFMGNPAENKFKNGIYVDVKSPLITIALLRHHQHFKEETSFSLIDKTPLTTKISHHKPKGQALFRPPFYELTWNWKTMSGLGRHIGENIPSAAQHPLNPEFIIIPKINFSPPFLNEEWKTTVLGNVGAIVGTGKSPGYCLKGTRTEKNELMRILMISDQDMLVDVPSTQFFRNEGNWMKSDHLEILTAEGYRWAITLSDGQVFPFDEKLTSTTTVEMVQKQGHDKKITGLKIHLPHPVNPLIGVSVSYCQANQKQKPGFIVSTSQLIDEKKESMSTLFPINNQGATTKIDQGILNWAPPVDKDPFFPMINFLTTDNFHSNEWDPNSSIKD